MNAERLRSAIEAFLADYQDLRIIKRLAALENTFTQSITAPTAESSQAFLAAWEEVKKAAHGECSRLSPCRLAILESIGADKLCGVRLVQSVDDIVTGSPSPATVVERLGELRREAAAMFEAGKKLTEALEALRIDSESPPGDRAEVEVRLPGDLFDNSLGGLAKEAKALDRALLDIVESVSGSRPALAIQSLATGSLEIVVTVDPVSGAALLAMVTALINLINSVIQTRRTRLELEKQKVPKDVNEKLDAWEKGRVREEIERLRDSLLSQAKVDDERRNELRKGLTESLEYLADRLDRGMDVDVAILPPPSPEPSVEGEPPPGPDTSPEGAARRFIADEMMKRHRLDRPKEAVLALPAPSLDDPASTA